MKEFLKRWAVPVALMLVFAACEKKEEQPAPTTKEEAPTQPAKAEEQPPAQPGPTSAILDAAITAHGGLEKLKAASSWTGKSKGTYMGMPYTSTNTYRPGEMHMDISMPSGEPMSMAMGLENCWMKTGPVVVPCCEEEKKANRLSSAVERASQLWPLKEGGWEIQEGKTKVGKKELDSLTVKSNQLGATGILGFDPQTHLLVRTSYQGSMYGQPGEFVGELSGHKEFCGVKMPTKISVTFGGKPYLKEEVTQLECGAVNDQLFAQPEQVRDGTVVEKDTTPATVACHTLKGPYSGISGAIEKLTGSLKKQKIEPMGAAIMFYLKAPPKVKNPKQYVTEICLPIGKPAPKKPKKQGDLMLKGLKKGKALAAFGVGDYAQKAAELAKLLGDEAKKRNLQTTGQPMSQLSYMDPKTHPADQLVSEMRLPIKESKKPEKGKK